MTFPSTLSDIRQKVRRITGRPSSTQITDAEIDNYINTYYRFDMPSQLRLENLKVQYEFTTTPNIAVYDFDRNSYLTNMPPVYVGGYQIGMTQSRENFYRIQPAVDQENVQLATGNGTSGPYTGTFSNTPFLTGFKPNPPGAFSSSATNDISADRLNFNVVISASGTPDATSGIAPAITLVDDGQGNLFATTDTSTTPSSSRGTVNYITGAVSITDFGSAIPSGNAIMMQAVPYTAARPIRVVFFQDQFIFDPVPDKAYPVSFEVYKYPTALAEGESPQLQEWWQLLAYGASLKIFADNADFDNLQKYYPLLLEQKSQVLSRTVVQQTSRRAATIYTDQAQYPQSSFGGYLNNF